MSSTDEQIARLRTEAEAGDWMSKEILAVALRSEAVARLDATLLDQADYWYWKGKEQPRVLSTSSATWSGIFLLFKQQIEDEIRKRGGDKS
ncbi:MAG: hypothetical protein JWN73_1311 [Betaproteobacteria bacterium]|nr:hypothetical protein [Betaproteobacteria bacterium]